MDERLFKKAGGVMPKKAEKVMPLRVKQPDATSLNVAPEDGGNETIEIEHPVLTEDREAMNLIASVAKKGFIFRHEKFTEGAKHDLEKTQEIILDLKILMEMILGIDKIIEKMREKEVKEGRLMVSKNGYELTPSPRDVNANDKKGALQMFRDIKIAEEFSGYIDLNLSPKEKEDYLQAIQLRNK
ncbi:MAG: hypothetical protein WC609_01675 [Candidatus Paceibacterota bacterium]|jgi:hypothetical protein